MENNSGYTYTDGVSDTVRRFRSLVQSMIREIKPDNDFNAGQKFALKELGKKIGLFNESDNN